MTSGEERDVSVTSTIQQPINLRSVNKQQLLLYLSEGTPISTDEFAEKCTQAKIEPVLRSRFNSEIDIDAMGFITLSGDARRLMREAVTPFLKQGRGALEEGQSLVEEEEHGQAVSHFWDAVSLFESVQDRLAAVNADLERLNQILAAAKQRHDSALKETTKDSINYHVLQAQQHESEGDDHLESDPERAIERYQAAKDALSSAIDEADEYNEARYHSSSPTLSIDPLQDTLETIETKLQKAERATPQSSSEGASEKTERKGSEGTTEHTSTSDTEGASREELINEVERLAAQLGVTPSNIDMKQEGRYAPRTYLKEFQSWHDVIQAADIDIRSHLIDDLRAVRDEIGKPPEPVDVDEHGQYTASRFKRYFGSWDDTLAAADIDSPTKQDLIADLRRVAKDVDGRLTADRLDELGQYSSTFIATEFESWTDAVKQAGIHESETWPSGTDTDPDTDPEKDLPSEVKPSAFENSWETIPDSSRLDGQFLAKVDTIDTQTGERKSGILTLIDRTGKGVKLDVWSTHELELEWSQGEWYALKNARGTVWETSSQGVQKRLSSTKDLERITLGGDFDPDSVEREQLSTESADSEPDSPESTASSATGESSSPGDGSEGSNDSDGTGDEILDDIMSDFDGL